MKKTVLGLTLCMLFLCGACALADTGVKNMYGQVVQLANYAQSYNGWIDISGLGGNTLQERSDVRVISRNATVRAEPSTGAKSLGSVSNGSQLSGRTDYSGNIMTQNGFYAVEYKGQDGWISSAYCVCGPFEIVLQESNVPAYCAPNSSSKRVGSLEKCTRLTVLGFYGDYYVVNLRQASAFIPMSVRHYDTAFERLYYNAPTYEAAVTYETTLRTGPGSGYTSLGKLRVGYSFRYCDILDGYCMVWDDENECYVFINCDDTNAGLQPR